MRAIALASLAAAFLVSPVVATDASPGRTVIQGAGVASGSIVSVDLVREDQTGRFMYVSMEGAVQVTVDCVDAFLEDWLAGWFVQASGTDASGARLYLLVTGGADWFGSARVWEAGDATAPCGVPRGYAPEHHGVFFFSTEE